MRVNTLALGNQRKSKDWSSFRCGRVPVDPPPPIVGFFSHGASPELDRIEMH